MTSVLLVCDREGCIKSCVATGHAEFARKGSDIVCAAESSLMRTAVQVLESTQALTVKKDVSTRGTLAFHVECEYPADPELKGRLKCVADFLRTGFGDLTCEYPDNVQMREEIE